MTERPPPLVRKGCERGKKKNDPPPSLQGDKKMEKGGLGARLYR